MIFKLRDKIGGNNKLPGACIYVKLADGPHNAFSR